MITKEKTMLIGASLLAIASAYYLKLPWILPTLVLLSSIILVVFLEFEKSYASTRVISILAFITALTVVSRQVLHGIEVSPVFFFVIVTGYVFGAVGGFVVGAVTMFASNFFVGGQGPWTPFQMVGLGLVGFGAAYVPKAQSMKLTLITLSLFSVLASFLYSAVTDVFWWMAFTSQHTLKTYLGVSMAGVVFSTARAIGNLLLTVFFGPTFIKVFMRFRKRFLVEYVE